MAVPAPASSIPSAYISDPLQPAYAECVATWIDDRAERIRIWQWIATHPEPLGYDAETMFGSYDFPNLTMLALKPWKIRLATAGDVAALRVWES